MKINIVKNKEWESRGWQGIERYYYTGEVDQEGNFCGYGSYRNSARSEEP